MAVLLPHRFEIGRVDQLAQVEAQDLFGAEAEQVGEARARIEKRTVAVEFADGVLGVFGERPKTRLALTQMNLRAFPAQGAREHARDDLVQIDFVIRPVPSFGWGSRERTGCGS